MIIKSVTRKQPSFGQLLNYLNRGRPDPRFCFQHNVYSRQKEAIQQEFESNARFLKAHKGSVYLYHEILSIKKAQRLSEVRQKEILYEIARNYVMSRANRSLVYGVLHDDRGEHLHYHLMISGNEAGHAERTRISRGAFAQIKKQLEDWVLERFPELEQTRIMGNVASGEKLSRAGGELKRRTGKTPERDDFKARLKTIFQTARDKADFFRLLDVKKAKIYLRGQSIGFEDLKTGRKHRLKTLGLEADFAALNARIEQTLAKERQKATEDFGGKQTPTEDSGLGDEAIRQARERLESEAREQAAREALRAAQAERARVEARHAEERRKSQQKAEKGPERSQPHATDTGSEEIAREDAMEKDAMQGKTVQDSEASAEEAIQKAIEQRRRELAALRSQQGPDSSHERKR